MSCEGLKGEALKKCQDQQKKKDIPFSPASEYTIVNDADKKAYFNRRNIPVSEQGKRLYYNKETKTYKGSEITDKPVTKAVTKTPAVTKKKAVTKTVTKTPAANPTANNFYGIMSGFKTVDRVSKQTFDSYTGPKTDKYNPEVGNTGVPIGPGGDYRNDLRITDKRNESNPMPDKTIEKFKNKYGN